MQQLNTKPAVAGLFPMVVRHVGATPIYGTEGGAASANVALLNGRDGRVVVLMTDGGQGCSITNAAPQLIGVLYHQQLQGRGVALEDVRWIYRDSEGAWDEIIPVLVHGTSVQAVDYRVLGARQPADMWAALASEGVCLSADERARLDDSLGLTVAQGGKSWPN